jgi:hypothetical protein
VKGRILMPAYIVLKRWESIDHFCDFTSKSNLKPNCRGAAAHWHSASAYALRGAFRQSFDGFEKNVSEQQLPRNEESCIELRMLIWPSIHEFAQITTSKDVVHRVMKNAQAHTGGNCHRSMQPR